MQNRTTKVFVVMMMQLIYFQLCIKISIELSGMIFLFVCLFPNIYKYENTPSAVYLSLVWCFFSPKN